jgi:hypothetical protein
MLGEVNAKFEIDLNMDVGRIGTYSSYKYFNLKKMKKSQVVRIECNYDTKSVV